MPPQTADLTETILKTAADVAYLRGQWDERPCARHERRLSDLERWQWRATGIIALGALLASMAGPAIAKVFFQ